MFKNDILVNCIVCERCFKQVIKPNQPYCKKCIAKSSNKKASNSMVYKMKFNKNSRSLSNVLNVTQKYIGKYINIYKI